MSSCTEIVDVRQAAIPKALGLAVGAARAVGTFGEIQRKDKVGTEARARTGHAIVQALQAAHTIEENPKEVGTRILGDAIDTGDAILSGDPRAIAETSRSVTTLILEIETGGVILGQGSTIGRVGRGTADLLERKAVDEVIDGGFVDTTISVPRNTGPSNSRSVGERLADKFQNYPSSQRPNTVAILHSADGRIVIGRNQGGVTNPEVQTALEQIPPNQFGGACAEANCIAWARNKGIDVRGSTIEVVNVRGPASTTGIHGTAKPACSVCNELLKYFGIRQ